MQRAEDHRSDAHFVMDLQTCGCSRWMLHRLESVDQESSLNVLVIVTKQR